MNNDNPKCIPVDCLKHSSQQSGPGNRINHVVSTHKKFMIVIGGVPTLSGHNHDEHHQTVHYYNFDTKVWAKKDYRSAGVAEAAGDDDNFGVPRFSRSYQAYCTVSGKLYLFGGSNHKNEPCNDFLVLNLQTYEWDNLTRENTPKARESGCLAALSSEILVLYGGMNLVTMEIYERIHLYFIKEGVWREAGGNYSAILRPRYNTAMCCAKNKIYIYGGEYRNYKNEHFTLDDFYELTPHINAPPTIMCALVRPEDGSSPEPKAGHSLVAYDNYLVLIGGDTKEMDLIGTVWVFSLRHRTWRKVELESGIQKLNGFACSSASDKIILYGGVNSHDSVKCDIFSINMKSIMPELPVLFRKKPVFSCSMCEGKIEIDHRLSKETVENIVQMIDFPFSAFGLLLENASNYNCHDFYVEYASDSNSISSEPMLIITETNNLPFEHEELLNSIGNFEYFLSYYSLISMDRKARAAMQRECSLREYGIFIKLGSLRLGEEFVYTVFKGAVMFVYAFMLTEDQNYEFLSYVWDWSTKKQADGSEYCYQRIWLKYGHRLIPFVTKSEVYKVNRNYLFIFNLRQTMDNVPELQGISDGADIQYSPYRRILGAHNPVLKDSIDVSLKSYMSAFFLKTECPKMKIKFGTKEVVIVSQKYLESFDRMVKSRSVFEIDNAEVNIELKIMELYFNPNLVVPTQSFHNGVLLYHRGRLIQRFGCRLGEMYTKEETRLFNFFHMFGLLEVPDQVQINIFRTDFVFNVMVDKLKSKLKFLEEHLKFIYANEGKQAKKPKHTRDRSRDPDPYGILRDKIRQQEKDRKKSKEKDERYKPDPRSKMPNTVTFDRRKETSRDRSNVIEEIENSQKDEEANAEEDMVEQVSVEEIEGDQGDEGNEMKDESEKQKEVKKDEQMDEE